MPCHGASTTAKHAISRSLHGITPPSYAAVAIGDENNAADASDRLMDYVEEFTRAMVTNRF
jgi:hypothetical protein